MIQDIIEEIKKVNQMLDLHSTNKDSDFMLKQYQSKRDLLEGLLWDSVSVDKSF